MGCWFGTPASPLSPEKGSMESLEGRELGFRGGREVEKCWPATEREAVDPT